MPKSISQSQAKVGSLVGWHVILLVVDVNCLGLTNADALEL